jgi:glyoxylase-like metal-dependent hydrolase (beta-lactamase superfamily II)
MRDTFDLEIQSRRLKQRARVEMKMRRILTVVPMLIAACWIFAARAQAQGNAGITYTSGPVTKGKAFNFEKIADGVYYATASGTMITGSNDVVIVNDNDVLLVDAGVTPAVARALVQDVKLLTDKPIRWVVNTHFHYDHTDGNSVFGPDVQIIAHEYVRYAILNLDVLHREPFKTAQASLPGQIEALKKQASAETDAQKRAALQQQLSATEAEQKQFAEIKPTPPTMTYASHLTLHRGQREIQLLFLGRGHTPGDTVIFLPKERIVCTGDLMESRLAYMGDGIFDEWVTTLDAVKKLDFDTVLPGHGVPFHEKALITAYQSYLKDLTAQVAKLRAQGVTADEAAQKVDLTSHKADFPQITGPGADVRGVRRMYQWMDERGKQ